MKTPELPKYCYARGRRIWVRYKNADGVWVNKRTQYTIDQVEYARRYVNALLRGVDAKRERGDSVPNTVKEYVMRWLAERDKRGVASAQDDRRRLLKYALPHVGHLAMEEVRPRHIRDMVRALRQQSAESETGTPAPRTIHHVYNALHNVFENAIVDEVFWGENPVKVASGELPKKIDKDPEWRPQATFALVEIKELVTNSIIPTARRVQYALKALSGLRHGEVAALCWRHIDWLAEPLARLNVVQAWCSRTNKLKRTKTEEARSIPVHPALARILIAWRDSHWARVYGRKPTQDDFVVPTRTFRCVAAKDANDAFKRDLDAVGLRKEAGRKRHRGGHDLRSWYETTCIEDGADSTLLRRTTHAAPKNVSGGYERFSWAALCREVAKLQIEISDEELLSTVTRSLQAEKKAGARWTSVVTPKGLERFRADSSYEDTRGHSTSVLGQQSRECPTRVTTPVTKRPVPVTPWVTVAGMIERAVLEDDKPRLLEIVRHLQDIGHDADVLEAFKYLRVTRAVSVTSEH